MIRTLVASPKSRIVALVCFVSYWNGVGVVEILTPVF
jgi:hypothetical protein